jgi:hypothetical protein
MQVFIMSEQKSRVDRWQLERAASRSKARHALYGRLGAASACRRIDPKTGKVIEEIPARFDRGATYTRPHKQKWR